MTNSVDPDQTAPIAVCPGSTLLASIINSSVMLGNYLQQTTFSDAFFLGVLRVNAIEQMLQGKILICDFNIFFTMKHSYIELSY